MLFDLCNVIMDRVLPAQHLSVNSNSSYFKKILTIPTVPLFRKSVIPTVSHFSVYSDNSDFIKVVLPVVGHHSGFEVHALQFKSH